MPYATRADVELLYGPTNVQNWADLQNDRDPGYIDQRVAWALTLATSQVNGMLKFGPHLIPFEEPLDPMVVDMTARLAGVLLYESRDPADGDEKPGAMARQRNAVDKLVRRIRAGQIVLNHPVMSRIPGVVK